MSRADKFLWSTRVFKSRSDAVDACRSGKVKILDNPIKPSKEINVGDTIAVKRGEIFYSYRVLALPLRRLPAKEVENYIVDTTPQEELEKLELKSKELPFGRRERGSGRPTKKERRTLDSLIDSQYD